MMNDNHINLIYAKQLLIKGTIQDVFQQQGVQQNTHISKPDIFGKISKTKQITRENQCTGFFVIGTTYCMKSVQIWSFSGLYFLVFRLNKEIYGVNLRIQSEYRKIRTRKTSAFGRFSRSVRHESVKTMFENHKPYNAQDLQNGERR